MCLCFKGNSNVFPRRKQIYLAKCQPLHRLHDARFANHIRGDETKYKINTQTLYHRQLNRPIGTQQHHINCKICKICKIRPRHHRRLSHRTNQNYLVILVV